MTAVMDVPDRIGALAEKAVSRARLADRRLHEEAVPALQPSRRSFAQHLSRRLSRSDLFEEAFVRDLRAFLGVLDVEIEAGTHHGWEFDENDVHGASPTLYLEADATTLASCRADLLGLCEAIEAALDAARAERMVEVLLGR